VPDALFAEPRLAELYDLLEADRSDLEVYAALVDELGARRILDVGCGTGSLACLLARRGAGVPDRRRRAGFAVLEIRDAPDRPGLELVFVARRDG
jgi:hypothetical protein